MGQPFRTKLALCAAAIFSSAACAKSENSSASQHDAVPSLRRDAATVCRPSIGGVLVLELPPEKGFRLNTEPFDSTRLVRWFDTQLARRVPDQRMVFIRLDSTRRDELRWLVPAIERAGGGAYEPDSRCAPIIHTQAPIPPAV